MRSASQGWVAVPQGRSDSSNDSNNRSKPLSKSTSRRAGPRSQPPSNARLVLRRLRLQVARRHSLARAMPTNSAKRRTASKLAALNEQLYEAIAASPDQGMVALS